MNGNEIQEVEVFTHECVDKNDTKFHTFRMRTCTKYRNIKKGCVFTKDSNPKIALKKSQKLGLFSYFHITVCHPVCWVLVCIFTNKILQIFPVKFVFGVNGCIKNRRVKKIFLLNFCINLTCLVCESVSQRRITRLLLSCCHVVGFLYFCMKDHSDAFLWFLHIIFIITFYLAVDPVEYNKNNNVLSILDKKIWHLVKKCAHPSTQTYIQAFGFLYICTDILTYKQRHAPRTNRISTCMFGSFCFLPFRANLNNHGENQMEICPSCVPALRSVQRWPVWCFCPPGLSASHVTENYGLLRQPRSQRHFIIVIIIVMKLCFTLYLTSFCELK